MDYDFDIALHLGKTNVAANALSKRPVVCGAKLEAMGIEYEDKREDVANRHLVIVLVRLTISSTIANCIRLAKVVS